MMETMQRRAAALGAVGAVVSGALAVGIGETTLDAWAGWGRQEVAHGLGVLAGAAAAATSAWVAVVLTLATLSILRGDRGDAGVSTSAGGATTARRPGWTGRAVAGLLVLGSLGVTTTTAGASEPVAACAVVAPSGHPQDASPRDAARVDDAPATGSVALPEPGWTPTPTHPHPRPSADVGLVTTAAGEPVRSVVVQRGDTLWGIAARHLGDRATDQDVAEAWPRWYAANRTVIGDDPDLIRPGQQLTAPASTAGR